MTMELSDVMRWTGDPLKYSNPEKCTLALNHGGYLMDGAYIGGQVCYLDHVTADYLSLLEFRKIGKLSLLEFRKIGKYVGYDENDLCSGKVQIHYRVPGTFEEIVADSTIVTLIGKIPPNRFVEIFYVGPDASKEFGSQFFLEWPTLDDDEFNLDGFGEIGINQETETDKGEQNEENDDDFVDSEYEYSEDDDKLYEINVEEGLENFEAEPLFEHTGNISSDEANSEDFDSLDECEDNIEEIELNKKRKKRKPKFKTWKRQVDLKNPQFRIGMMFANKKEAKEAMEHHSMRTGRAIRLKKNDKTRLRAICEGSETCPIVILAARKNPWSDTFVIKTLQLEHQCGRVDKVLYADSRWLSEHYIDRLRTKPNWDVDDIMAEVRREFNLVVTRNQVFRAKRLAREVIEGSYVEQYARLWDYVEELKKANKGSTIKVKTQMDGDDILFQRIYVCLAGCKQGFLEGCRPVIGVDGCFIKGSHSGQILTAVGIDGNNGLFPIAYAIVEIENKSTWVWFLELLIADLKIENGLAWAFVSDKQKGLESAIKKLLPTAEHRMCVRHLHQNFKASGFQGLEMKNILWAAARATTVPWWKEEMEKMKNLHEKAWEWLNDRPANNWSRSRFNTHYKCDVLLNNLCESFNSAIVLARNKPILGLLDNINMYIMLRMANRKAAGRNWKHPVGPRIFKIIEKSKVESTYCIPKMAGEKEYLVQHLSGRQFVVKLKESTCSCRRWDLCGIPCSHAIACIFARDESVYTYVHDCYKKEAYLNSYDPMIHPVPGMDLWDRTDLTPLKPPICKKQPGRPKRKRIVSVGEVKRIVSVGEVEPQAHYPPPPTNLLGEHNDTPQPQRLRKWFVEIACGTCGKLGHNKVGCGKSQHTNATNKNQETQQVNTQATTQNAQANSQTSGTQMSQGNTETRAPINSQGKKKQHVSFQAGQQGKGKQPVRRGGYKGMGNQARPWRL